MNALHKQKAYSDQFDYNRVAPILKNSDADFSPFSINDFPPLPILKSDETAAL